MGAYCVLLCFVADVLKTIAEHTSMRKIVKVQSIVSFGDLTLVCELA